MPICLNPLNHGPDHASSAQNGEKFFRSFGVVQLAIACLFLSTLQVYAQQDYRFERITVDDGLSQSAVTSIVQDKYGYLWIGTLDGLNRYDGSTFTVYREEAADPSSLPAHSISKLLLDQRDRLWVAYRNGLSLYDPASDKFTSYKVKVSEENLFVRDFDQVSDSLAMLCTNQGVLDFNLYTGSVAISEPYRQFKNKRINELVTTKDGSSWLFADSILWRKQNGSATWAAYFRGDGPLKAIYDRKTEHLYVRTANQLLKLDADKGYLKPVAAIAENQWPNSSDMLRTSDGSLWVAHGGISILDKDDKLQSSLVHISQDPNSLSGSFVSDICQTRDGVIWVGTNGLGLNKYNPWRSVFGYLGNFPGAPLTLSDNYVTSIYTEDDVHLIVNTLDGFNVIDLAKRNSRHYPVIGKDGKEGQVLKVFKDSGGRTWLATSKGLMFFENNAIHPSGIAGLDAPGLVIYDVAEIARDKYVLATSKSVMHWDRRNNRVTEVHRYGSQVLGLMNGHAWIEAEVRVKVVNPDGQVMKAFPVNGTDPGAAPIASVKCFYQDSDGNIWLGTDGGGLSLYDSARGTFTHIRETEGLSNNVVYGILEDASGNLWLSTNKGLSVFDRRARKFIRAFNKADGLQGNEFNTRAYFKSPSGKMYFGGVSGLSFFDPAQALRIPSFTPKTILTSFYINNVRQDSFDGSAASELLGRQKIELNWNQRNFSFDVAGLGFTFPSGTQYQYKLENFDTRWNFLGNQKRIAFTNMPAGSYTLYVKSGNSFGEWEKDGLAISIEVFAPFWESLWFIVGAVALVLMLFFFISFQRARSLRKRAFVLQGMVEERTREIQRQQEEIAAQNEELVAQAEILENSNQQLEEAVEKRTKTLNRLNEELVDQNTQLEQFTFITAHNIRGPVARIRGLINLLQPGNHEEIMRYLETSVNQLDGVITDLNAVLNITHGIGKAFEPVSVKEQLLLVIETLSADIASVNAHIDIRHFEDIKLNGMKAYFQSIFYNLIHNALKFSDPKRKNVVRCLTLATTDRINIVIEDTGVGIDMKYAKDKIFKLYQRFHPDIKGKGYGLFLVQTQIKAMAGEISVDSEVNVGTTFSIDFPLP